MREATATLRAPHGERSQARRLLQDAGLRHSLGRQMIIEALWRIAAEQDVVGIYVLQDALSEAGAPLSVLSIRQALRRLEAGGLVVRDGVDRYRPGRRANDGHYPCDGVLAG
ncbi:hypothetical protein JQX08_13615 [Pseudomonas sp. UL073]|uniref:Ferric uptake regulation protein n=1 Tax=Zestomonas insulae TaxID=2809017 RepID=A0ABS2III3_9GAMM|nr:hypothetical protein [Pseudomonas insulae]MBM7061745.1 hypothetical protein [Pseudomonas insulae]